jgi:hypothetical protein
MGSGADIEVDAMYECWAVAPFEVGESGRG